MIENLISLPILILFGAVCAFIFFLDKDNHKFNFIFEKSELKNILISLGIFLLLFISLALIKADWQFYSFLYFAISFISAWLISLTKYSCKSILILLINFILSLFVSADLMAQIMGLITFSILNKNFFKEELITLLYLSAFTWIKLNSLEGDQSLHLNCILAFSSLSILINYFKNKLQNQNILEETNQNNLIKLQSLSNKNILLLFFGGLISSLIITENILLSHKLFNWSILFGIGILFSAISDKLPKWSQIALIGILTLIASRLIGTIGFIILGISALPFIEFNLGSSFWLIRTLLQVFITQFNSNITGINLMHPYTSAALFGGILLGHLLFSYKQINYYYSLLMALFLAFASNYFLHSEASSSFLISFSITSLCLAFFRNKSRLIIFPAYIISLSIIFSDFLELGLSNSRQIRLIVFIILAILFILLVFLNKNKIKT